MPKYKRFMMKRIVVAIWLVVFGGMVFMSCTKNEENTVALIGTEYYIDDIVSVIPDSLQSKFWNAFGTIPEGPVPPKIEGSYVVEPKTRVASNVSMWPLQIPEPNMWLRFSDQHNGIVKMDLFETTETITDTVFVCGEGQDFAVYFIENMVSELGKMKRGIVMKGKMTDEGLADFRYATITLSTENSSSSPASQTSSGSFFIYKDGDGLAKIEEW